MAFGEWIVIAGLVGVAGSLSALVILTKREVEVAMLNGEMPMSTVAGEIVKGIALGVAIWGSVALVLWWIA